MNAASLSRRNPRGAVGRQAAGGLLAGICLVALQRTEPMRLSYRYTTETTYQQIDLANRVLRYTDFPNAAGRCATWLEQRPCWKESDLRTRRVTLAPGQGRRLLSLITRSGLLTEPSGAAPPGTALRSYDEILTVEAAGRRVTSIYRSYPGAPPRPKAHAAVRNALLGLVQAAFRSNDRK